VRISAGDMTHTVIEQGLKDGELIITGPYKVLPGLKDGQEVKEQAATTQPTAATKSSGTKPATRAAGEDS
jgi:hypothetical protein